MIEVGQTVGNYVVLEKIAQGVMGDVYLAEHPIIGRKAALKVIHPQHVRNVDIVARFVNEAAAISKIGHEHIVEVLDFGRTPAGDFYIIMEYLEGRSLAELIVAEAPLAPARALELAAQIADALAASHAQGVIHRDLKPENVFLVTRRKRPDFVKVVDFGLAKLQRGDRATPIASRAASIVGTPYYMAPEQCEGAHALDGRADVYALGVILFEMLTGKLPFGGDSDEELLLKQMTFQAPAVRSLVPEVPSALEAIVRRALAKAPADRFPSMEALGEALLSPGGHATPFASRPNDDGIGVLRDARPMSRAEISKHRNPPAPPPEPPPSVPAPRRRAVSFASIAALVAFVLAAAGAFWWFHRMQPSARADQRPVETIAVNFSSDPDGATVVGPNGVTLGTTPLSILVPRADTPVAFGFVKAGFEIKTMSLIPNVASSLFAAMQPTARKGGPARRPGDGDGVLTPSFLKK